MSLDFNQKKICIVGYGREGKAVEEYLKKHNPSAQIGIADASQGEEYLNHLDSYDILIKSPGVPAKLIPLQSHQTLIAPTQMFFDLCPNQIIGITGTKGKSTTSSLIHHILSTQGIPAVLMGNIGIPAIAQLDSLTPDQIVVMELSSHQLAEVTKSPHIAILLNIYPEHMDYYDSMDEYVSAKANITKFQTKTDYLVYDAENNYSSQIAAASHATTIPFIKAGNESTVLLGEFNQKNIAAATKVAELFKLTPSQIAGAIKTFRPLEHRLQTVAVKNNIVFVDDTLATLPEATIAALDALNGEVATLIAGGAERHQDFQKLAQSIVGHNVTTVLLFPETGTRLRQNIETLNPNPTIKLIDVRSMEAAINEAFQHTPSGKICLLSPASPSFGLFKDYADKSAQFKAAIESHQV